jgi:hypothetical protein
MNRLGLDWNGMKDEDGGIDYCGPVVRWGRANAGFSRVDNTEEEGVKCSSCYTGYTEIFTQIMTRTAALCLNKGGIPALEPNNTVLRV